MSVLGLCAALALSLSGVVAADSAQVAATPPGMPHVADAPIDQGIADRGSLSTSFRSLSIDLAVPTGFRELYALPGGGYYRAQGAIYAVYPSSAYLSVRGRDTPVVPADTVFHIGPPPELAVAELARRHPAAERERALHAADFDRAGVRSELDARREMRVDGDVGTRAPRRDRPSEPRTATATVSSDGPASHATTDMPLPRFIEDESYRRTRLRALLR